MNRFWQFLALFLINRELRKMEKAVLKNFQSRTFYDRKKTTFEQALADPVAYTQLVYLKHNIEHINNPWGGVFAAGFWTRLPKHEKYIEPWPKDTEEEKAARAARRENWKNEFFDGQTLGNGNPVTEEEIEKWIESYEKAMEELENER